MNSILEGRPALKKEVEKIAEVAGYLWQNGWAERNGGNITVLSVARRYLLFCMISNLYSSFESYRRLRSNHSLWS